MLNSALLDLSVQYLLAGLFGGIVRIFFAQIGKIPPKEAVRYIVVGAAAGNFLTPAVLLILHFFLPQLINLTLQVPPGFLAFVIGMSGLRICKAMDSFLAGKLKKERMKNE